MVITWTASLFLDETVFVSILLDLVYCKGITSIEQDLDAETVISKSDKIMYISKKNGKDQITVDEGLAS